LPTQKVLLEAGSIKVSLAKPLFADKPIIVTVQNFR